MMLDQKLTERYGILMSVADLAEELRMTPKSIHNAISAGRFPVRTFKVCSRRVANTDDVAAYIEHQQEDAV